MKLRESKNLKCDKYPWIGPDEGYQRFDPKGSLLAEYNRVDDKIILYFKNGSQAVIGAVNVQGGREMDAFEGEVGKLLGRSYEDILDINI